MHKSRLGALIIDCRTQDLRKSAKFWSEALGLAAESPQAQKNPNYIKLETRSEEPQVLLQQVDHPSRVHLDIETDNVSAEVKRLESLGATVIDELERWTVMEAPSGHRFCVINAVRADFQQHANRWE